MRPDEAKEIAKVLYRGRVDAHGIPEIEHPLEVAKIINGDLSFDTEKVVAYLHDSVEDELTTINELRSWGMTDQQIQVLDGVTRKSLESYNEYIQRIADDDGMIGSMIRRVKIADLKANLNRPPLSDSSLEERYELALALLERVEYGED